MLISWLAIRNVDMILTRGELVEDQRLRGDGHPLLLAVILVVHADTENLNSQMAGLLLTSCPTLSILVMGALSSMSSLLMEGGEVAR